MGGLFHACTLAKEPKYCISHRFDWNHESSYWLRKFPFQFTVVPDAFVVVELVAADASRAVELV